MRKWVIWAGSLLVAAVATFFLLFQAPPVSGPQIDRAHVAAIGACFQELHAEQPALFAPEASVDALLPACARRRDDAWRQNLADHAGRPFTLTREADGALAIQAKGGKQPVARWRPR